MHTGKLKQLYLVGGDFVGLDFTDTCFKGAELKGANFSGSNLTGCDFRGARLKWVDFTDAVLTGIIYDETTVWPEGFTPPASSGESVTEHHVTLTKDGVDFLAEVNVVALTAIDAAKRDHVASEIVRLFEGWIGSQLTKNP